MTHRVLVTGGTGFVGGAVLRRLLDEGCRQVIAAVRTPGSDIPSSVQTVIVPGLTAGADWSEALVEVEAVVHCAARAHVMKDSAEDPLNEFRQINTAGTLNLARQAAQSGVKRFIYLSTIKVNGECTNNSDSFTADDKHMPRDPYGVSKSEAEIGLLELAKESSMEVVIIRPPLVYGPGVKGNFASLMRWIDKGIPLPLGAVHNQRSLVALDNLVDFILHCMQHPAAANEVFLVSDGDDISTSDLLKKIASAFGKPSRLIPIPVGLMKLAASMVGKTAVADRLFGSLTVDISKTRDLLGWQPVISMDEQLKKMVEIK
jgi:nucleoside-diphosphate-sugar epimerase